MSWQICKIYKHSTFSAYSALFWNLFFQRVVSFSKFEMNPEDRPQYKNCVLSRNYFVLGRAYRRGYIQNSPKIARNRLRDSTKNVPKNNVSSYAEDA